MNELFQLSNLLVIPWWLLMIVAPHWIHTQKIVGSSLIFVPIALLYSVLVLPSLPTLLPDLANPQLAVIRALLSTPDGATIAWIHFLALDGLFKTIIGWSLFSKPFSEDPVTNKLIMLPFAIFYGFIGIKYYSHKRAMTILAKYNNDNSLVSTKNTLKVLVIYIIPLLFFIYHIS